MQPEAHGQMQFLSPLAAKQRILGWDGDGGDDTLSTLIPLPFSKIFKVWP
jgi:hypothetical protein